MNYRRLPLSFVAGGGFLDPDGGSQKATVVVLVLLVLVMCSLKIPKAFSIRSGAQRNCVHIRAHIPHRSTVSDFKINF